MESIVIKADKLKTLQGQVVVSAEHGEVMV
jgi:hypothetical protein